MSFAQPGLPCWSFGLFLRVGPGLPGAAGLLHRGRMAEDEGALLGARLPGHHPETPLLPRLSCLINPGRVFYLTGEHNDSSMIHPFLLNNIENYKNLQTI